MALLLLRRLIDKEGTQGAKRGTKQQEAALAFDQWGVALYSFTAAEYGPEGLKGGVYSRAEAIPTWGCGCSQVRVEPLLGCVGAGKGKAGASRGEGSCS